MSAESRHLAEAGDVPGPMSTRDAAGLTVAGVMHADMESLPATVTVGELRDWFAVGTSRRLAVIAADGRYVGSLAAH